jgi:hypothetical protein
MLEMSMSMHCDRAAIRHAMSSKRNVAQGVIHSGQAA